MVTWKVPVSLHMDLDLAKRLRGETNQSEVIRRALREYYEREDGQPPAAGGEDMA